MEGVEEHKIAVHIDQVVLRSQESKRFKLEGEEMFELALAALHDRDEQTAIAALRRVLTMDDARVLRCLRAVLRNRGFAEPWLTRAVLRFQNNILHWGFDPATAELLALLEADPNRPFALDFSPAHPIAHLELEPRRLLQHELEQYLIRDVARIVVSMLPFAVESFHLNQRLLFPAPSGDEEFMACHLSCALVVLRLCIHCVRRWVEHEVVDINNMLQVIALQQVKINNAQRDVINGNFAMVPDEQGPKVWVSTTCDWFLNTGASIELQSLRLNELEQDPDSPAGLHVLSR